MDIKCIYTLKCGWSRGRPSVAPLEQHQEGGSLAQGHLGRAGRPRQPPVRNSTFLCGWGLEPVTLRSPSQDPGYQPSLRLYVTLSFFQTKMASCARCTQANARSRGLKGAPVIVPYAFQCRNNDFHFRFKNLETQQPAFTLTVQAE